MKTYDVTVTITHDFTFEGIQASDDGEVRDTISDLVERQLHDYEGAMVPLLEEGEDVWEDARAHEINSIQLTGEDDEES